jgi:prepilin-type N-terminal cleavage/methylation domain-containing protein
MRTQHRRSLSNRRQIQFGTSFAYLEGRLMRDNRFTNHERGFTLVEVMISSVILLLVLGSVMALASRGYRYVGDLRRTARSSQVLQQKMEDIRLINIWTNVWALNNVTYTDTNIVGMTYRGTIHVNSYNPPYPTSEMARVTLTLTWTNSQSHILTNRLTALVCKNGLNKYIF